MKHILAATLLALLLAFSALYELPSAAASSGQRVIHLSCTTLYFLNSIMIFNTTFSGVLYLETPQNISLGSELIQNVTTVRVYNLVFNKSVKYFQFSIKRGQRFFGYMLVRVDVCGNPMSRNLNEMLKAYIDPYAFPPNTTAKIPPEIEKNYLGKPPKIVLDKLRPVFIKWFEKHLGAPPKDFGKAVIAVYAAHFIKSYIHYALSPYPRPLKVIIEKRIGDCDDMARALIALLWSFGIPAVMAYGYVVIQNFNFSVPVEKTLYVFHNMGPHAFALAYIPGYGWLSLDLLAYSLIYNPFVFEGWTTQVIVNQTAVKQFKNLSKQILGVQIFYALTPLQLMLIKNFTKFVLSLYKPYIAKYEEEARNFGAPRTVTTTTHTKTSTATSTGTTSTWTHAKTRRTVSTETTTVPKTTTSYSRTRSTTRRTTVETSTRTTHTATTPTEASPRTTYRSASTSSTTRTTLSRTVVTQTTQSIEALSSPSIVRSVAHRGSPFTALGICIAASIAAIIAALLSTRRRVSSYGGS